MIPESAMPTGDDAAAARAYAHAAGVVWDAMRDLFAAYVIDTKPTDPEEFDAFANVPAWADLAECPSLTFVEQVFAPFSMGLCSPVLDIAEHHREEHAG